MKKEKVRERERERKREIRREKEGERGRERKRGRKREREGEFKCFRETVQGGRCCFEYVIKFWREKRENNFSWGCFFCLRLL